MRQALKEAVDRIQRRRTPRIPEDAQSTTKTDASVQRAKPCSGDLGDSPPPWDPQEDRASRLLSLRGISASVVDLYADCPKKFDFFVRGVEPHAARGIREAIYERVRFALDMVAATSPDERTIDVVEPAIEYAWQLSPYFNWLSTSESDAAKSVARKILREFVEVHDFGGQTTALNAALSAEVSTEKGDFLVEATIERVLVDLCEEGVTLAAYDMGDPGEHKYAIQEDPVMRIWLLVASESLRTRVARIKNVFVRYGVEEVFEPSPAEVDGSREFVGSLINEMRFNRATAATPGVWCGSCGYQCICAESHALPESERRLGADGLD